MGIDGGEVGGELRVFDRREAYDQGFVGEIICIICVLGLRRACKAGICSLDSGHLLPGRHQHRKEAPRMHHHPSLQPHSAKNIL